MSAETRTLKVDALARVEGEGSLRLRVRGDSVEIAEFAIYEPPRFFEALLRGRHFSEAPDITARICGICPVAYQLSAARALEDAAGVSLPRPLEDLRRLLYCGEWLQSHALHVYLLHAPDFLGCANSFDIAKEHPDLVRRGLALKQAGNNLIALVGGRAVHPINVRVGGFHRAPTRAELQALVPELEAARDAAAATVRWVAGLAMPELTRPWPFLALNHPKDYPLHEGDLAASTGLRFEVRAWPEHVVEDQAPHSTALWASLDGARPYLTGPLARFALGADRLTPLASTLASEVGLTAPCRNPFRSIVVRALEMVLATEEALRLIAAYVPPAAPSVAVEPRNAVGHGATEAPRGVLYHRYAVDGDGRIEAATITPPTAQNQAAIESDVRAAAMAALDLDDAALGWRCEQAIRNHDPCISCATHFLDVAVDRG